jgi:ABC-type multidrug transport system ATPase subunit
MTEAAPRAACDFDVVTLVDVSRHYGRRRALAKVSLDCPGGSIIGLFGPNGAGKTTVLGILSTLVQPSRGSVRYGVRAADEWGDVLRSRIGVLGHDLFLYGDLTARENLRFFGALHDVTDLEDRIDVALAAARLSDRADDRVSGFSRGLRQRLALERALLHRPRLVLLDEPFTGLDDVSSEVLVGRLRELRATGAIVVMATHDFDTADGLVDRAICLHEGTAVPIVEGPGRLRERYRETLAGALR